jgi:hypothetical protein
MMGQFAGSDKTTAMRSINAVTTHVIAPTKAFSGEVDFRFTVENASNQQI